MAVLEPLKDVPGVDHRDDRIEQGPPPDVVVDEEGLGDRRRIGEARGLDQDAVEISRTLYQAAQDADQVAANGAADVSVVHLEHFLVGIHHEVVVDADHAEFVDDDGVFPPVLLGQDAVQEGRLAGPEIAGQDGHWDLVHEEPSLPDQVERRRASG